MECRDKLTSHWCSGSVRQVDDCHWDSDGLVCHGTGDSQSGGQGALAGNSGISQAHSVHHVTGQPVGLLLLQHLHCWGLTFHLQRNNQPEPDCLGQHSTAHLHLPGQVPAVGDSTETQSNSPLKRSQVYLYSATCSISPWLLPSVNNPLTCPFHRSGLTPHSQNPRALTGLCKPWAVSHTHIWARTSPCHRGQLGFCFLTHELVHTCQAAQPGEPDTPVLPQNPRARLDGP